MPRILVEEFCPQAAALKRAEILMEEVDAAEYDFGKGRCVAVLLRRFDSEHGRTECYSVVRGSIHSAETLVGTTLEPIADGEVEEPSGCLRGCIGTAWGMSDA